MINSGDTWGLEFPLLWKGIMLIINNKAFLIFPKDIKLIHVEIGIFEPTLGSKLGPKFAKKEKRNLSFLSKFLDFWKKIRWIIKINSCRKMF